MAGETTTNLDEALLDESPGRATIEGTVGGLVDRGLMTTKRGIYAGEQRSRDGHVFNRVYEDDWWDVTAKGRQAVGLPPKRSLSG
jgi:hypothetical protein